MIGQIQSQKNTSFEEKEDIFIGVDIGWKKTLVSHLYPDKEKNYIAKYSKIAFGGYDISMVNSKFNFQRYNEMLSILLTGSRNINVNNFDGKIIQEFSNIYSNNKKDCEDYYYGLFDLIAMEIEYNNFSISPDVYNKMDEYNNFIKMITYNILLLFLNIGYLLGKMRSNIETKGKHIHIYLGGNGAKFLKWIINSKDCNVINEENENKVFIIGNKGTSILDIIKNGFSILGTGADDLTCTIEFASKMKEQLIEGYIFSYEKMVPHFQPKYIQNIFYKEKQELETENETEKKAASEISPEQSQENNDTQKNTASFTYYQYVNRQEIKFYESMRKLRKVFFPEKMKHQKT